MCGLVLLLIFAAIAAGKTCTEYVYWITVLNPMILNVVLASFFLSCLYFCQQCYDTVGLIPGRLTPRKNSGNRGRFCDTRRRRSALLAVLVCKCLSK